MDLIFTGMKSNKTIPHCKMSAIGIVTINTSFQLFIQLFITKEFDGNIFSSHPFHP